ncbi:VOC family protein [Streptomyces sp. 8K308]|uniref:VOC family protein n=1 Tax=Streptomyces sp. 8K308 TaxID=2530388 RepID=UPI001053A058|nr:VOC family protein [Streptomyces sp. 8K308]TDC04547.1 VOC family protein [Streptomyces sp. 8K308]
MDLTLSHCFLPIDDHDEAIAFYHEALGLDIRDDVSAEDMRWVTLGSPNQPGVNIVLEPPVANPDAAESDRRAITDLMAKGMLGRLDFATDDLDSTYRRIRATGAEILQEPIDQPYGVRDCAFRDPSGNMIRISETRA